MNLSGKRYRAGSYRLTPAKNRGGFAHHDSEPAPSMFYGFRFCNKELF